MLKGTPPESIGVAGNRADSIVARFIDRASSDPERTAFTLYPTGSLQAIGSLKWGDWITKARAVSGAFLAQHAKPGDRVAIFANNRELWPVATMGIAMCGLVTVAIPPNETASMVEAQLADCGASIVIVDTITRFRMLRSIGQRLSRSITIICDDLEPLRSSVAEGMFEWETWCRYGAQALQDYELLRDRLTDRLDAIRPEHTAQVNYAIGSGVGVVRTFETILSDAQTLSRTFNLTYADRVTSAESVNQPIHLTLGIHVAIVTGVCVALIEHPSDAYAAARNFEATVFTSSSRTISRLQECLALAHNGGGYLRDAVCEVVGRHCRMIVTAGDVCSESFQQDLQHAGVALATIFGTEWQSCICVNGPAHFEHNSIGTALDDIAVRIGDYGELQVRRNSHTAVHVYNRKDTYDVTMSADGQWHNTGVRVERSMSGWFRITGKMKDMLEFSSGRLVAPLSIEASLAALPLVAHAMCQADGLNSLVAILSLNRQSVEAWAFARGVVAPWEALVEHPVVYEELSRGVALVNAQREPGERITGFAPTDLKFNVHTGELDDNGALVRSVIANRFRHVFAELHQHRPL